MRDMVRDKDFLAGAVFILVGGFFAIGALDYGIGSARRMGPGYFPVTLGTILVGIGAALAIKSAWQRRADMISRLYLRPVVLLGASIVAFAVLLETAGLVAACIAAALISGAGGRDTRLWEALIVAIVMAVSCSLLFVAFLGLPIPLWGQ